MQEFDEGRSLRVADASARVDDQEFRMRRSLDRLVSGNY
jgi:hypothetical protein